MECIIKLIPEDTPAKHTLDYIPVRLSNIYSQYHIFNLRIHRSPRESLSTVPAHRKQITTTKPATRISYQSTSTKYITGPIVVSPSQKKKTGQK